MKVFARPSRLFELGEILSTPGAISALGGKCTDILARHSRGDWGDLGDEDKELNDNSVVCGARILSSYTLTDGVKVWIITEAVGDDGHRACTTILLPEEY